MSQTRPNFSGAELREIRTWLVCIPNILLNHLADERSFSQGIKHWQDLTKKRPTEESIDELKGKRPVVR